MKKPVPPSNFQTNDSSTRSDLDRVRRGYQELLDWIAAQLSAYGTIVSNASRYLLRSANDFISFPHKASPVAADKILIEDSAASGSKKYAALSELAGAIGASGGSPQSEFWATPAAPNASDYEADSSTLPASWTLFNITTSPATIVTPVSGIDPQTQPAAGTCRVEAHKTNRRSWILFQPRGVSSEYWFYGTKITLSGTAGWVLRSRLATHTSPSTAIANNAGDMRLYVIKDDGTGTKPAIQGAPGFATDGVNIGWENDAGSAQTKVFAHNGGAVVTVYVGPDVDTLNGGFDSEVVALLMPGATGSKTWQFWFRTQTYTYYLGTSVSGTGAGVGAGDTVWVGWYFSGIDSVIPASPIMRADYMRFENTAANFLP